MHSTACRGTRNRGRAPSRVLIGRQLGPPLAEWLECVPELSLRRSFVERRVDVGDNQYLNRRGESLELARLELHRIGSGKSIELRNSTTFSPIATISFGCTMWSSRVRN